MSRQDAYLDAMLRHLGAAYYQTLQGAGSAGEVARAVAAVTEFGGPATGGPGSPAGTAQPSGPHLGHRGRWRVRDVMTTHVATVPRSMHYKQVARLMAEHHVSALPVVGKSGRLLGIVSEADVLKKEERGPGRWGSALSVQARREQAKASARTAGELMTSPAITINPDAPLGRAARLMNTHRIRRLPVVDAGRLIGIVSRRDLLRVFLRPDEDIAAEISEVFSGILLEEARQVAVRVNDGVVTLAGELSDARLIPAATRLASDVDGVVAVTSHLTAKAAPDSGSLPTVA